MKDSTFNWGLKPFRVLNCWFLHEGFAKFVEDEWGKINVHGWGAFVLKEKLKRIKEKMKEWNKLSFGHLQVRRLDFEEKMKILDLKYEGR